MKASIDIGSNSILLEVGEAKESGHHSILSMAFVTGLAKGVDKTKKLSLEGQEESLKVLKIYRDKLLGLNLAPEKTLVTATEASRNASNFKIFAMKVKDTLGFNINLISAKGEAYYCALGVGQGHQEGVIIDLGGASTELISFKGQPFSIKDFVSLPIGSVRATEWIQEHHFEEKLKALNLPFLSSRFSTPLAIGVAGTITCLAAMMEEVQEYSDSSILGKKYSLEQLKDFQRELEERDDLMLQKKYPFLGKRVSSIRGGAKALVKIMSVFGIEELIISTYGLRHGLIKADKIESRFLISEV